MKQVMVLDVAQNPILLVGQTLLCSFRLRWNPSQLLLRAHSAHSARQYEPRRLGNAGLRPAITGTVWADPLRRMLVFGVRDVESLVFRWKRKVEAAPPTMEIYFVLQD